MRHQDWCELSRDTGAIPQQRNKCRRFPQKCKPDGAGGGVGCLGTLNNTLAEADDLRVPCNYIQGPPVTPPSYTCMIHTVTADTQRQGRVHTYLHNDTWQLLPCFSYIYASRAKSIGVFCFSPPLSLPSLTLCLSLSQSPPPLLSPHLSLSFSLPPSFHVPLFLYPPSLSLPPSSLSFWDSTRVLTVRGNTIII